MDDRELVERCVRGEAVAWAHLVKTHGPRMGAAVARWLGPHAVEADEVPIACVATVHGRYTGSASRAYLYYSDEDRAWVPGLAITIRHRP